MLATVILGTTEHRTSFRGNGETMVGLGITKQSTANTIAVAKGAQKIAALLNPNLPPGMRINQSFNSAVFIEDAIDQVYTTLAIALLLVVLVIFIFLGSAPRHDSTRYYCTGCLNRYLYCSLGDGLYR